MKKPLSNVAESVRARLLNLRTKPDEDYHELLVRFCLERLLYRLSISAHRERFVLKGAMLFALWQGFLHRRTRDLDLLGFGDPAPESVAAVFKEIVTQSVPVDDGILFDTATVEAATIKSQDEYVGARVKLCAFIGQARIWLQVDVGYGDSITPEPLERAYPGLLDFPQAMLRCYAPETALAEKFEAVVTLGLVNSRMKDYFDFWTIGHQFSFDGTIMADTIFPALWIRPTGHQRTQEAWQAGPAGDRRLPRPAGVAAVCPALLFPQRRCHGAGLFGRSLHRIPHLLKSKPLEVLDVGGGEFGDAEGAEGEGGAGVVDAAAGEAAGGGALPEVGVEFAAGGREAEDFPARVLAVALDDGDGLGGGERFGEDGGVSEQEVEFGEDEFAQGDVFALGEGLDELARRVVLRGGFAIAVKEEIGVDGEHRGQAGSGEVRLAVGKGGVAQLFGAETFPAHAGGGRRRPDGPLWGVGIGVGIDLQQQLGSSPKGLGEGPFALFGESTDFPEERLRNLNLGFCHTGDFVAPLN